MKKLNEEEQAKTNGGGLLGGDDSSSNSGLTGSLGIGNLLSSESSSQDGDESSSQSTSIGNDIGLGGTGASKKQSS